MANNSYDVQKFGDWVSPELVAHPGLAVDVAKSANPKAASVLLSHAVKTQSTINAVNDNITMQDTGSFWQDFLHTAGERLGFVAKPISVGLDWMMKPLAEVSKDYKFVHAMYTDQGPVAGILATLGIAAGGVAGAVAGPTGAILGADLAAAGIRNVLGRSIYKKQFDKSEDENYKVSFGRDFSNGMAELSDAIGVDNVAAALRATDKGIGKTLSGLGDATFDVVADPINALGRLSFLMKQGKFLHPTVVNKSLAMQIKYPLTRSTDGVQNFMEARSLRAVTPEQLDKVRNSTGPVFNAASRQYNRALDAMVKIAHGAKDDAAAVGEIAVQFPQLGQAAAGRLGTILRGVKSPELAADAAHDFFKTQLYFGELRNTLAGGALLPSRTMLKSGLRPIADVLRDNPGRVGQIYKTFSGYMPKSLDTSTMRQSMSKFRWDAPDAAGAVYAIARYGQTHEFAVELAGQYAQAVAEGSMGLARKIKNQAITEGAKAMGLSDDLAATFVNKLDSFDRSMSGDIFGVSMLKERGALGEYDSLSGEMRNSALWDHQGNVTWSMPNFLEMKYALKTEGEHANLFTKLYGKSDDFVAHYYTNSIFKPLALMSAGFGMRIAAAELLPQFARYGVLATFQSGIAKSIAKSTVKVAKAEEEHIAAAAAVALGVSKGLSRRTLDHGFPAFMYARRLGLKFASKMTTAEQVELASRLIIQNEGHLVSDGLSSGHGNLSQTGFADSSVVHGVAQKQMLSSRHAKRVPFTMFSASNPDFEGVYATNLSKASQNVAQKSIAADMQELMPAKLASKSLEDVAVAEVRQKLYDREYRRIMDSLAGKGPYTDGVKILTRFKDQDPAAFAADRVDAMMGMLVGDDGTFLNGLAAKISAGKKPTLDDLKKIDPLSLPKAAEGQPFSALIPSGNPLQRVIDVGFKKMVDPIVNNLAREPVYLIHVADEYKSLQWAVAGGQLTEDMALRIAQVRATQAMLPQIHNVMLRSQFAQITRNLFPFYFAQEQAMKRTFAAMKDTSVLSPAFSAAARFYQMSEHALSDPAVVTDDGSGNRYINMPLVGEVGFGAQAVLRWFGVPMVGNLPVSVSGNLASLQSVLPEMQLPGVSPFFAVSSNIVNYFMPDFEAKTKGTLLEPLGTAGAAGADLLQSVSGRSANRGFWDTVIPNNSLKNAFYALNFNEQQSAVANSLMSAMSAAYYHNEIPGPNAAPQVRQAFLDRIRNNARSILAMKALFGLLSPLSPKVEQVDPGLREEFYTLVRKTGNYQDAIVKFLGEHGDRAVSYTVSKTEAAARGANVQYTKGVIDWIDNNQHLVTNEDTSRAALYLVPQAEASTVDWNVYSELMRQHLRSRRSPTEFMKQFYVSAGWNAIEADSTLHDENMTKYANVPYLLDQERARWSDVLKRMQQFYPDWYTEYTSGQGRTNAVQVLSQFRKIFSSDAAPSDAQSNLVRGLVSEYDKHEQRMKTWKMVGDSQMASMEKDRWQSHLTEVITADPSAASVVSSIFRKLD